MNKLFKLMTAVLLVATVGTFSACKKNFDNPPGAADPNIVANTTLQALKALHVTPGAYDVVTTDLVISGIVVANDKSGNLYKQLFIQDSTGGLQILLDAASLYGTYPVGRRIFIKCKDLCISDYNGTMELGVKSTSGGIPSVQAIPSNLISKFVVAGSLNNPVVPKVVSLSQLTTDMQSPYLGTLIQLNGYEFSSGDTSKTYSDTSVYKSTTNLTIKDCGNSSVIIRTSAYANFAGKKVPGGNGSVVAIYTTFNSTFSQTRQLILRDADDVKFTGKRCAIFEEDFNSIGANSATLVIPGWKNIGETGNVLYQNAVFSTTKCAKISAFGSSQAAVTSWFISPAVNLAGTTAPKLTFTSAAGYVVGSTVLQVLISTNYNGSATPSTSTWTQVYTQTALTPTVGYGTLTSVGNISLSAFIGQTVYIGFKYLGGDPTKTTTYEFDDVKVTDQ
jgi:hypothetical protein